MSFRRGETIHTEDSYKYSPQEIAELANRAGLRIEAELDGHTSAIL